MKSSKLSIFGPPLDANDITVDFDLNAGRDRCLQLAFWSLQAYRARVGRDLDPCGNRYGQFSDT